MQEKESHVHKPLVIAVAMVVTVVGSAGAQETPTFNKDVAPILFDNCVICHREGQMAPMALTSYSLARPWARAIKDKVVSREMPPWHADATTSSLTFKNDRSLSRHEIDTIVAWAEAGAPEGNPEDLQAAPQYSDGWLIQGLGDPDMVIYMPVERHIEPDGELPMENYYVPVPWEGTKYAKAIESRPSNFVATHHTVVHLRASLPPGTRLDERGVAVKDPSIVADQDGFEFAQRSVKLTGYAPGKGFKKYPEGSGRMLPSEWYFVFNQHYQPTGKPEVDRSMLGLWFHDDPVSMDVREVSASDGVSIVEGQELLVLDGQRRPMIPNIPPHADNWKITTVKVFPEDTTVFALSPHMHLRGKDFTYVLVRPDGSEELLLNVPRYDFNWQTFYELEEPLVIPAGSKIVSTAHFDNSFRNRYNPSPDKEVYWAEQSWDEMFIPFFEYGVESEAPKGTTEE